MSRSLGARLLLTIAATQFVSCSSSRFPSGELIMFATFGPHAFEGTVRVVRPDGSRLTSVLNPQTLVGYEAAHGNSLKASILVSVAQSTGGNGMETMDLTTMQRSTIVPFNTLHGSPPQRATEIRGISWAKTQDKIVLILQNLGTFRDELWTVSSNGSNLPKIYTADAGVSILSVTFISN